MASEEIPSVERETIFSVQFLRGFAAMLVLVDHLMIETGIPNYGGVGVDIFFVISGFIIYYVTRESARHFLTKRIIRIVPLYWLATFGVAAVALLRPDLLKTTAFDLKHFVESLFFIPHYTEVQGLKPLLSLGWTLNYEMAFYLVFALAMFVSHRMRFEIATIFLLCVWAGANLLPLEETNGLFFYRDSVFLEFIFGMAIAHFVHGRTLKSRATMNALLFASMILFLTLTIWSPTGLRIIDNGVPSALLFAVFLISEPLFSGNGALRRTAIFGGEISYALYLIHMYFIAFLARVLHLHGFGLWVIALVTVPLASWLIYRIFELPMTHWLRRYLLR